MSHIETTRQKRIKQQANQIFGEQDSELKALYLASELYENEEIRAKMVKETLNEIAACQNEIYNELIEMGDWIINNEDKPRDIKEILTISK